MITVENLHFATEKEIKKVVPFLRFNGQGFTSINREETRYYCIEQILGVLRHKLEYYTRQLSSQEQLISFLNKYDSILSNSNSSTLADEEFYEYRNKNFN